MGMYFVKDWYCEPYKKGAKVVSFSDGTDAEIAAMLQSYYNNELTWEEMGWNIGDTRMIHLNTSTGNGYKINAQEITIVIVAHNHTVLETPINGHNNACITVQFRETLSNDTSMAGSVGVVYTFSKWANIYMRTYINGTLLGTFSYSTNKGNGTSFKDMIKPSKHYRHTTYNGTASEEVIDTLFLPSYPEVFGTAYYAYYKATSPTEGTQFAYYNDSSNIKKVENDNGSPKEGYSRSWWLGSPSSAYNNTNRYSWAEATTSCTANYKYGTSISYIAPAWAM